MLLAEKAYGLLNPLRYKNILGVHIFKVEHQFKKSNVTKYFTSSIGDDNYHLTI